MAKPKGKKKSDKERSDIRSRRRSKEGRNTTKPKWDIPDEQTIKAKAKDFDWMNKVISRLRSVKSDDEAMRVLALIENFRQHPRRPKYNYE